MKYKKTHILILLAAVIFLHGIPHAFAAADVCPAGDFDPATCPNGPGTPMVTGGTQAPLTTGGTQSPASMTYTTLQNPLCGPDNQSCSNSTLGGLISTFVTIFSYLVILFAVLMLIWTGLQYILARGNPEEMKKQTVRLGYIIIGIATVIGARVLITLIIDTLQASGTVSPDVIHSAQNALNNP